jgi:Holliday junction resolvasome RuvABC ATP-dependent DNA helicase subunit
VAPSSRGPLGAPAGEFIDAISTILAGLSGKSADDLRPDVAVEASNIAAAVIDADGRLTDDELWAYSAAFGPELSTSLAGATPTQLRDGGVIAGKRAWVDSTSVLYDLLVAADRRNDTRFAHRYYERAMRLAHGTAALDLVPSPSELAAIDALRGSLLVALDRAGLPRPGAKEKTLTPNPSAPVPTAAADSTPPAHPPRPIEELLAELDALVGLADVKKEVRLVTNLLQVQKLRRERNLPVIDTSNHLVFTGNPGTGKTSVARLLAQIYRTLGVVSKGQLVETDRARLVAGYVGQTALKTKAAVDEALGGILLVDEAYALVRGGDNDFGREAIDTLVKEMEDHRDDLAVIAAGYTAEMAGFIAANPGLRSRFTRTIHFPDYSDDELVRIFVGLGTTNRYRPTDEAIGRVRALLANQPRDKGFGNARFVRNLFEQAVTAQASRIVAIDHPTDDELTTIEAADLQG